MTPRKRALTHAAREQHTIAILGAWAERSEWARVTARVKLRELIPGAWPDGEVSAHEASTLLQDAFKAHRAALP